MAFEEHSAPKRHWNEITPGRLLVVLLAVEVTLFLSEHWYPKGWAVLIAATTVAAVILYLLARLVLASCSIGHFNLASAPC